jgi:hypothetical protein
MKRTVPLVIAAGIAGAALTAIMLPGPVGAVSGYERNYAYGSDLSPGDIGTVSVQCSTGKTALGGGFSPYSNDLIVKADQPDPNHPDSGWRVQYLFPSGSTDGSQDYMQVWVTCAS